MDTVRLGRSIRALRLRHGWRQADLASAAGVSRPVVSRMERGELRRSSIGSIESVCRALDADLDIRVRWHGEGLDRLLDQVHAGIVDRFVRFMRAAGWEVAVEVTFNEYGDRGSIDVLCWQVARRALLVGEIKSVVADAQGTLSPLDRKARLGAKIGRSRGWDPLTVSRVLVVRDGSTNRRRVDDLAATFDAVLPDRAIAFRKWIRDPVGSVAALVFFPDAPQKSTRRDGSGWQRVSRPRSRAVPSQ
jgi:transcriptional regulator with XRE-family HTH domain